MNIPDLFSTKERIRLLEGAVYKTERLKVNEVAKGLRLSKGLVSKLFEILVKEKVLKRVKNNFLVQNNLNAKSIRILLNLGYFNLNDIFKKYKFVKSAGLYGSFVKGENTEDSDIDLWVIIEKTSEEGIARLTSELKKRYKKIRPIYLTKEKLRVLKKEDLVFYYSLVFGSIAVYGEEIESV